jgi:Domain of unknown function (DUF4190)
MSPEADTARPETKRCPACAETVQADAAVCRFCSYDFRAGTHPIAGRQKTNGFAIASLVLGVLGILPVPPTVLLGSILALIFGYMGRGQIDRSQGRETGRSMAVAGIALGWIGIALTLILVLLAVLGLFAWGTGGVHVFHSNPGFRFP